MLHKLDLQNVSYKFRNFALDNINLVAKQGEIVYLVGKSGSGKSTLLRNIAGLDCPSSGSIYINGGLVFCDKKEIFVPPELRKVGFVFQHPSLFPSKSVIENVMFAISGGLSNKEKYKLAIEMLENVNMVKYINSAPHELSGGQQQLVVLARAFAQKPEILLLDEPFSSLDVVSKRIIREEVISYISERNLTAIFVTHDPEEALANADMIYIIDNGEIICNGAPSTIYYSPNDARIAVLFGEINKICGTTESGVFKSEWGEIPLHSSTTFSEVYVRPEGITLATEINKGISAIVENIQFSNKIAKIRVGNKIYFMHFPIALIPKKYDTINVVLDHNQVLFL